MIPPSLVLLPTAVIHVRTASGYYIEARALCDTGAQGCLLTTDLVVDKLNKSVCPTSSPVRGIGNVQSVQVRGGVSFTFKPVNSTSPEITATAMVLDVIAGTHPELELPSRLVSCVSSLPLADPFFSCPGPIDVLLGADVFGSLLRPDLPVLYPAGLTAVPTIFGYTFSGPVPSISPPEFPLTGVTLSQIVERFWKIEEPPEPLSIDLKETECERIFQSTTTRELDGRFVVRLPFLPDRPQLGDSKSTALRRFFSLEKRLLVNPGLKEKYVAFMREYLELGHMSPSSLNLSSAEHYFIPHHGVFKSGDESKIRVVFDGSSPTSTGVSLNQCLHSGPKLQRDITSILLNFRRHAVVFVADIRMMFRMTWVHPQDRRYQLILWRESPNLPLCTYELNTNTYGLRSSPYIAIRALLELAEQERSKFPLAASVLESDVYVDDCLTGAASLDEARVLMSEMNGIMSSGGYELRKWISNRPELLANLPPEHLQLPHSFQDPEHPQTIAVLGVQYDPAADAFTYRFSSEPAANITKRKVLSLIARTYDPCGWITPVIFKAKAFMQSLWLSGLSWDEPLTPTLAAEWNAFSQDLINVNLVALPRPIMSNSAHSFSLHGFCDASEAGYAAVVYLRTESPSGFAHAHLLMAKSKVAPVRTRFTIPKLELLGATLLSKILHHVASCLQKTIALEGIYSWSDSRVVLAWIKTPIHHLQTFEANRVSQIQNSPTPSQWRHVPGNLNPADCASRGISISCLLKHSLWWSPHWLIQPPTQWPATEPPKSGDIPGIRCLLATTPIPSPDPSFLLDRFSSLPKLVGVVGYILRFVKRTRYPEVPVVQPYLSADERKEALLYIVRQVQHISFPEELDLLHRGVLLRSPLRRLCPFLDHRGLIRVGGRLKNSDLPYDARHPLLLPKAGHFVQLLVAHYHVDNAHAGPNALLALISREFWILSARRLVNHVIFKCLSCYRLKAAVTQPPMGDLPRDRVVAARPFDGVGTDFAGPFYTKVQAYRNKKIVKSYLCVFVCLSTKAVHLEVVSDLTTEAFLAALTRFVSRRGLPSLIRSDNGRNYVGANNYLGDLHSFLAEHQSEFTVEASKRGINWVFDPPLCPHWGGLFEAAVKSAKTHLKRVIGDTPLTFEELTTVFAKIEAVLNSRPLCPLASSPDLEVLTPGHFLIGQPLVAVPEYPFSDEKVGRLTRFQLVQQVTQHFWSRWHAEYLSTLQSRHKWTTPSEPPAVGELVLLKDENTPPLQWRRGRILHVYPGQDSVVRVVDVQTPSGVKKRSLTKLVRLPIDSPSFPSS